jgi:pimeloyl-ACP methyl ester carboxylesterase
VFVHGILSDGDSCWRNENGVYWPDLVVAESDLENVGVYVFTYETGVFSGGYSIGDAVDALKEYLRLDEVLDSERLIFVCHSMGGIVVRRFLVKNASDLIEKRQMVGLFLVASPSLGARYADWLSPLIQFFGHSQAEALKFVRHNEWLRDLDKDFLDLKESRRLDMRGKELLEDKFLFLKKVWQAQVVEPFAGAKYFGEPFKVPASDHWSIAKPESKDNVQHRLLVQFVKDVSGLRVNAAGARSGQLVLHVLKSKVEALHYSAREADVQFTVTNLTADALKITRLQVEVTRAEAVRQFRLATPGAMYPNVQLRADISERTSADLLSDVNAQFVVAPGSSDAFSLTIVGKEGYRYDARIDCDAEILGRQSPALSSSAEIQVLYPIRSLEGLHGGA